MKKSNREKRNFTLIELLIVVAIIAILAGMLLPALAKARKASEKARCSSNLKQIGNAQSMYRNDWNDFIAPPTPVGKPHPGNYYWEYAFGKLYLNGKVDAYGNPTRDASWRVFRCPEDNSTLTLRLSYGIVEYLYRYNAKGSTYKQPSRTYAIADTDHHNYINPSGDKYRTTRIGQLDATNGLWHLAHSKSLGPNHNNAANILFLDGHVSPRITWKNRFSAVYYDALIDNFVE